MLRGFGAVAPFTLVWHDHDVARRHLPLEGEREVSGRDRFVEILDVPRENGVEVRLE